LAAAAEAVLQHLNLAPHPQNLGLILGHQRVDVRR